MFSKLTGIVVRSSRPAFVQLKIFRCFHAASISSIDSIGIDSIGRTTKAIDADRSGTISPIQSIKNTIRLSKLLSRDATNVTLSRRQAERLIRDGEVTLAGKVVQTPQLLIDFDEIIVNSTKNRPLIKLSGKPLFFNPASISPNGDQQHSSIVPKIWAVHKVKGEVVTEIDPHGRPSLLDRLKRSGVGRMKQAGKRKQRQLHLKPIGRLDIPSEGLILVTNDGGFAREMELPSSKMHRVYRVRVHGRLTTYKIDRIRKGGIEYENVRYPSMKVAVEKPRRSRSTSSNTWLRVTCTEGKNRQIRNVFAALGLSVTRLIRIAYGDYKLDTIPPGMAIPVPYKPVTHQKAKGSLAARSPRKKENKRAEQIASPVKWVTSVQ